MSYGRIADKLEVGNLIQTQLDSFEWFKREGLRELFNEINPITDYTGKNYELRFLDYEFGDPKYETKLCYNLVCRLKERRLFKRVFREQFKQLPEASREPLLKIFDDQAARSTGQHSGPPVHQPSP